MYKYYFTGKFLDLLKVFNVGEDSLNLSLNLKSFHHAIGYLIFGEFRFFDLRTRADAL